MCFMGMYVHVCVLCMRTCVRSVYTYVNVVNVESWIEVITYVYMYVNILYVQELEHIRSMCIAVYILVTSHMMYVS
jgi:hypothetical protein